MHGNKRVTKYEGPNDTHYSCTVRIKELERQLAENEEESVRMRPTLRKYRRVIRGVRAITKRYRRKFEGLPGITDMCDRILRILPAITKD